MFFGKLFFWIVAVACFVYLNPPVWVWIVAGLAVVVGALEIFGQHLAEKEQANTPRARGVIR